MAFRICSETDPEAYEGPPLPAGPWRRREPMGSALSTPAPVSNPDRDRQLSDLEAREFDCLVIGGGITGAGLAREAARRGLSVALLEAEDFASGTSGRSSKLIHGGLRYLALGDVKLVRETARERVHVHREAPHLAEKAWMVIPSSNRATHLKFRTAVTAYEKLGNVADSDRHSNWDREAIAQNEPALDTRRYSHACAYREYTTDDARLVLANLRAAAGSGAMLVNRARVGKLLKEAGRVIGVEAQCVVTGAVVSVRARCVVNATGPWVSQLRELENGKGHANLLQLSKGVHVVLPRERLPARHLVILGMADRRSIFVVPRGDVVYVGTTDTTWSSEPDWWPEITAEDVDYLISPLSQHFRVEPVSPQECLAAWSGLRPLVAQKGKKPTEVSRRDEIFVGEGGLITIVGGKLTGYRGMARKILERVAAVLEIRLAPSDDEAPLPGGDFSGDLDALALGLSEETSVDPATASRLVRLYGCEAALVVARGAEQLVAGAPVLAGEVAWAVQFEAALNLEDFIYRRSRVAYFEPQHCDALLQPAAAAMKELLGWSEAHAQSEVEALRRRRESDLDFAREG